MTASYSALNRPSGKRGPPETEKPRLRKEDLLHTEVEEKFTETLDQELHNLATTRPPNLGDIMEAFDTAVTAATTIKQNLRRKQHRQKPLFTHAALRLLGKIRAQTVLLTTSRRKAKAAQDDRKLKEANCIAHDLREKKKQLRCNKDNSVVDCV